MWNSKTRRVAKLYRVANAARDRRDWLVARGAFKQIVDSEPDDSAAWVQYGHALKESGSTSEAEAAYLKAAGLAPNDADIQLQLGHLYKVMNLRRASIWAYRAAHALDPAASDPVAELRSYGVALEPEEGDPARPDVARCQVGSEGAVDYTQPSMLLRARPIGSSEQAVTIGSNANRSVNHSIEKFDGTRKSSNADSVQGPSTLTDERKNSFPLHSIPRQLKSTTRLEDIECLYELMLGRNREYQGDQDGRIGVDFNLVCREFLLSSEFLQVVFDPMVAGRSVHGGRFNAPPTESICEWAAARLPLSEESRGRVVRAASWYELHSAIFADAMFARDVFGDSTVALQLANAPMPLALQVAIIEASLLFDRDWYLDMYRDVAASGGDPLEHYLMHGVAEGRNPNCLFHTRWYLSAHPEVRTEQISPLVHYASEGAFLGFDPHPYFSAKDFLRAHPEATQSHLTPLAILLHRNRSSLSEILASFGPYDVYRATHGNYRRLERPELLRHIATMTFLPTFVIMIDGGDSVSVSSTRESLSRQIYPRLEVASSLKDVVDVAERFEQGTAYFLWLDAGDELKDEALYELAAALNGDSSLELIYFDHEVGAKTARHLPYHKPAWSPDYLEATDYIGATACFELGKAASALALAASRYDLLLRFTDTIAGSNVLRIDRVLMCRQPSESCGRLLKQHSADIQALKGRLVRTGRDGEVTASPYVGLYDIRLVLERKPLVSVIIPTAGRIIDYDGKRIDLIVDCLEAILRTSTYTNVEFIIVDNGDFDRERLKHIPTSRLKFITYSLPEVNIAKKINLGASLASGEMFLILNDDIQPLTEDWMEQMLGHFEKPHVGVVGAKLLYPNQTIQHAGIVSCDGQPEHVRRGKPRSDAGYVFSSCGVRNYLAVTGAVSMMRAVDFWRVGGYSEELPINYNDVDFCYKLASEGYSVVYEPKAELIHYESVSIGKTGRPEDAQFFAKKWAPLVNDSFYNQYCFSKHPAMFEYSYSERGY
ncbi:MAG: glycosyltransferase [Proteobacteria bacterium]|nr:glycosyltransferase [Pseudomonadota bacterium]